MPKHDYVEPYYMVQLCDDDLKEMQTYISNLKDSDYYHREIIHNNPIHSQGTDVYRTCEIHYPKNDSVLNQIGKRIFLDVNEKYYEYDLKDIYLSNRIHNIFHLHQEIFFYQFDSKHYHF